MKCHDPMHGGFVGMGMLDGACPGEVFTSPTPDQMHECAKAVDSGAGVLFIVKNYTGDVLNFETAAEYGPRGRRSRCRAFSSTTTRRLRTALVHGRPSWRVGTTVSWRRRLSAPRPRPVTTWLQCSVTCAARLTNTAARMGMALTSCIVPAAGKADLRSCPMTR